MAWLVLAGAAAALLVGLFRTIGPGLPPVLAVPLLMAAVGLVPGGVVHLLLAKLRTRPVPRPVTAVTVPALGLTIMALVVSGQLAADFYHPEPSTWALGLTGAVVGLRAVLSGGRGGPWLTRRRTRSLPAADVAFPGAWLAAVALGLTGAGAWWVALPRVRSSEYSDYGLGAQVPLLVVAVTLVGCALLLAVLARRTITAWALLLLFVLVRRGATLFATDVAMYQWTYRHLGVMDWFSHTGTLARDVDVYSNWPGALAFSSWLCDATGMPAMALAHGYPLVHHVMLVVAIFTLARATGLNHWVALLAAGLVEAADWVGQDYLAPQSLAFLLAIVLLATVLADQRWADGPTTHDRATDQPRESSRATLVIAGLLFAGITWMHVLTTVWVLVLVGALVPLARLRPIAVPVVCAALAGVMMAVNLDALREFSTGISLNFWSHTGGNIATPPSAGQQFTSRIVQMLALGLWLPAGLLGLLRCRDRRGRLLLALAFSPGVLLLTGYGGEAIYRVYLYSLPGVALIIAPALDRLLRGRAIPAFLGTVAAMALVVSSLQGSLGGWYPGLVSRSDVDLMMRLEHAAGARGLVVTPAPGVPTQLTWQYVDQARNSALDSPVWSLQNELVGPHGLDERVVTTFTRATEQHMANAPVYVVFSRSTYMYAAQYGSLPPGALERLELALARQGWARIVDTNGNWVYANPTGAGAYSRP